MHLLWDEGVEEQMHNVDYDPVDPSWRHIHGGPLRGRSLYKESQCTCSSLSNNTRRGPHLRTPTRSEEKQTVEMICRPNSKITTFTDVYLIYVLCSLFFAPLCTDFNFLSV